MSTEPSDDEELMPEEILEGLTPNSREIFSGEELAEFLDEWADEEGFVEDLGYVAESVKLDNVPPEKVFEHLAESDQSYSVEQMIHVAEKWSDQDWESYPDISGTGDLGSLSLAEKLSVPREHRFIPLSGGYLGETDMKEKDKSIWLQEHEAGWYQTEVKPLGKEELQTLFRSLERISPATHLHEANYEGEIYFVDSEDVDYFFEFEDEVFDGEIYRIESEFGDFYFETAKLPQKDKYRAMIFSVDGDLYPLDAYESVLSEKLVKGLKTRLEL